MDRIAAARERLGQMTAIARQAKEAGPPCSSCRFKTLLGNCANPTYAEQRFSPHSGIYEEAFFTSVAKARADEGLCGPEALLFEAQTAPIVVARTLWFGTRLAWFWTIATVMLILLLGR